MTWWLSSPREHPAWRRAQRRLSGPRRRTDWGLGAWAAGFNTVVVGGYVPRPNADGVARRAGWPSPFTRVGPGVADAPVPSFSAGAGDCSDTYQWKPGLGVWTSNKTGDWEDAIGTSHAAPIVAREAALLLRDLQKYCPPGVQAFASTAKAFLHLVARHEAPFAESHGRGPDSGQANSRSWSPQRSTPGGPVGEYRRVSLAGNPRESPATPRACAFPSLASGLKDASAPQCAGPSAHGTRPPVPARRRYGPAGRSTCSSDPRWTAMLCVEKGNASGAYPLINKVYDMGVDHLKDLGSSWTSMNGSWRSPTKTWPRTRRQCASTNSNVSPSRWSCPMRAPRRRVRRPPSGASDR